MIGYKYLNNPDKPPKDRALDHYIVGNFMVQHKTRNTKYYVFPNAAEFYRHYISLHPSQRVFNEIILQGPQKFRLDIDTKLKDWEMDILLNILGKIFGQICKEKISVVIYDIISSHHIVVTNIAVETSGCCHMLANLILHKVAKHIPHVTPFIDLGIYKRVQMFRIEGSTKYLQYRWKYRHNTNHISPLDIFQDGLIGYTSGCHLLNTDNIVEFALSSKIYKIFEHGDNISSTNAPEKIDLSAFTVRATMGNMVILNRLKPSYCKTCCRVHEHENAYLIGSKLYCRRSQNF